MVKLERFRHDDLFEEICAGLNPKTVAYSVLAEGWLKSDTKNAPYRRERLPGMGQVRCYVFANKMWEALRSEKKD